GRVAARRARDPIHTRRRTSRRQSDFLSRRVIDRRFLLRITTAARRMVPLLSDVPHDADDLAQDTELALSRLYHDWLHRGVLGAQDDRAALPGEALHGGLAVQHRRDDVAAARRLL